MPASGRSNPAIRRSVVVLPQPLGPSSARTSPASTSRSTSSTATHGAEALDPAPTTRRRSSADAPARAVTGGDPRKSGYPHLRWPRCTTPPRSTSSTILELEEEGVTPDARPPRRAARALGRGGVGDRRPPRRATATSSCTTTAASSSPTRAARSPPPSCAATASPSGCSLDVIGLEWEKVHREADRWEHAISADVEEKLVRAARRPGDVPARQPDPGLEAQRDRRRRRSRSPRPNPARSRWPRISEKLELSDDSLRLVAAARLIPGAAATVVVSREPDGVHGAHVGGREHGPVRGRRADLRLHELGVVPVSSDLPSARVSD